MRWGELMNKISELVREALKHLMIMLELPDGWQQKTPRNRFAKLHIEREEGK